MKNEIVFEALLVFICHFSHIFKNIPVFSKLTNSHKQLQHVGLWGFSSTYRVSGRVICSFSEVRKSLVPTMESENWKKCFCILVSIIPDFHACFKIMRHEWSTLNYNLTGTAANCLVTDFSPGKISLRLNWLSFRSPAGILPCWSLGSAGRNPWWTSEQDYLMDAGIHARLHQPKEIQEVTRTEVISLSELYLIFIESSIFEHDCVILSSDGEQNQKTLGNTINLNPNIYNRNFLKTKTITEIKTKTNCNFGFNHNLRRYRL